MDALTKDNNIFYNVLCFLIAENEKLFDRSDALLYWRTVFHIAAISHHYYISLYAMGLDLVNCKDCQEIEVRTLRKYRAGYLTGWNFLFQTTFLSLALLHDGLQWLDKHESRVGKLISYWRDVVFSGLAVPVTMFVTCMFWSVYSIDRELVFPIVYDDIVPWWFNHCVHTNILIVVCVETLLQPRRKPVNVVLEHVCVITAVVAYAVVYYSIYFFAHRWLYQVFSVMTWWQVCLFQCLIWASSYFFYRIQYPINRLIHGSEDPEATKTGEVFEKRVEVFEKIGEVYEKAPENGGGDGLAHVQNVNGDVYKQINVNDELSKDTKAAFADRSWSLKYRSIRNQFENSSL